MEDDSDDMELTGEVCQQRVDLFVEATGTDEALAQFYLQDREWNVERSVADYFDHVANETVKPKKRRQTLSTGDEVGMSVPNNSPSKVNLVSDQATGDSVERVRSLIVVTWNIDGLDCKNRILRTEAVCRLLRANHCDIALLQEVVDETKAVITDTLQEYKWIFGENRAEYYTAIGLKKATVEYEQHEVIGFSCTRMMRNLIKAKVKVNGHGVTVMTSHLESTKEGRHERVEQLTECFQHMKSSSINDTVLFGGDLNLRDSEVATTGLPHGILDAWIETGRRPELEYTWDMRRNDNLQMRGRVNFRPKLRFDRLYCRSSLPVKFAVKNFGLIGLERLKPHTCFPSDHWGVLVQLEAE